MGVLVVGVEGSLPPLPIEDAVMPTRAVRVGEAGRSFIRGAVNRSQNRPSSPEQLIRRVSERVGGLESRWDSGWIKISGC